MEEERKDKKDKTRERKYSSNTEYRVIVIV